MKRSFVFTALFTLLFSLLMLNLAEADMKYTVKKGDNLYKIAKKYKVPVDSLRDANNLDSDDLSVGKKLIIPSKEAAKNDKASRTENTEKAKTEQTSQVVEKQPAPKKNADTADNAEYEYHVVKKGDTPSKIAKKYGLSVRELKDINNLTSNKLKIGRSLIVSKPSSSGEKSGGDGNGENAPDSNGPGKRINVSEKIEEVKTLSRSDELSNLSAKERLMLFAKKMLDLPYKFGGNGIFGLDCSSFVQKVYGFVGQPLPRSAREQFKVGEKIDREELQTGDLIFFRTYASFPSHVGIYIGNNLFIHASSKSKKVQIDSLETPYYLKRFIGGKRLISEADAAVAEIQAPDNLKP